MLARLLHRRREGERAPRRTRLIKKGVIHGGFGKVHPVVYVVLNRSANIPSTDVPEEQLFSPPPSRCQESRIRSRTLTTFVWDVIH